jgi:ferric-dicitrate binding protein FerR (iron transport regulator)
MNDYLWDRSSPVDPEIARLEAVLLPLRGEPGYAPVLAHPATATKPRFSMKLLAAVAASLLVIAGLLVVGNRISSQQRIEISSSQGVPLVNREAVPRGVLRLGDTVETVNGSQVELRIATLGWVKMAPGSRLTVLESHEHRQRLRLDQGEVEARIAADPGVFVIETPFARVVDLGCAYKLAMLSSGEGEVRVTEGWIQVDYGDQESLVPAGSMANFAPGGAISPPYRTAASPRFRAPLLAWWQGGPAQKAHLLQALRHAEKQDALTLLNMLIRTTETEERAAIYDRLHELVPAPAGVSRDDVIAGVPDAEGRWWAAVFSELGLSRIKKKQPLGVSIYDPAGKRL